MRPTRLRLHVLVPLLLLAAGALGAQPPAPPGPAAALPLWTVDEAASFFAVLTHKAGVGARLAHDHLVVARAPQVAIRFDPDRPAAAELDFSLPVLALDVDPAAERAARAERLRVLGVLSGDLPPVDSGDRDKVRAAMLAPTQLFAARFPHVTAELRGLERRGGAAGARVALGWDAAVKVTVRGRTVERRIPVRFAVDGDRLTAEALGEFRFTEFGIEPYSAFLGAVRNEDLFHLVVDLTAYRTPPAD